MDNNDLSQGVLFFILLIIILLFLTYCFRYIKNYIEILNMAPDCDEVLAASSLLSPVTSEDILSKQCTANLEELWSREVTTGCTACRRRLSARVIRWLHGVSMRYGRQTPHRLEHGLQFHYGHDLYISFDLLQVRDEIAQSVQRLSLGPPTFLSNVYKGSFLAGKAAVT
jgi:hypothetical protein